MRLLIVSVGELHYCAIFYSNIANSEKICILLIILSISDYFIIISLS